MLPFKSHSRKRQGTAVSTVAPPAAWLGPSIHVKGDIMDTDDLLIHGSVEEMIQFEQRKLTVGTAARLTTDISAQDVVVDGFVRGDVRAAGQIEINKDGSVIGNLTATQILVLYVVRRLARLENEDDRARATARPISHGKAVAGELHEIERGKRS